MMILEIHYPVKLIQSNKTLNQSVLNKLFLINK